MKRNPRNPAKYDRSVKAVAKKGGANPYAVCAKVRKTNSGDARVEWQADEWPGSNPDYDGSWAVIKGRKVVKRFPGTATGRVAAEKSLYAKVKKNPKNPAAAAAQGYRDFHGEDPKEFVKIEQRVHFHKHLSGAGTLEYLKVDGIDGYKHTISGLGGALLAFNEKRNQLFVEGGDQSIDVSDYGIDPPHEIETLGKVTGIGYFTTKTHLGEDGGTAIYDHKFRTTNEDGRHVTVRIARYPDLIYRVLDEHLEFSGGSYEILPEGIDK